MILYPYNYPLILNDTVFVEYGGKTGTFTASQRTSSYLIAEMQVTKYIGTLLLPTTVTGTYPYMGKNRIPTDYGYVNQLLNVTVKSKGFLSNNCSLVDNDACGYIYDDTYGYVDFKQVALICGLAIYGTFGGSAVVVPNVPYQIQIAYNAGLPTGTANQPPFLEALTILAQIDLNEKDPGNAGMNETTGDVGVQDFKSLDYRELRAEHALVKTDLGGSAKAMRAKRLLDMSIRKARRALLV
jgi:hypothetical protein